MPTEELQSIADAANGTSDAVMFTTGFDGLAEFIHETAVEKGWWDESETAKQLRSYVNMSGNLKVQEELTEVDIAHHHANRRHDDVTHEGADDLAEGCTDNDADGHVYDIAAHSKCFEFF